MKSILTALTLVLTVAACATGTSRPDQFEAMALEWQGANIDDMLAVWGEGKRSVLPSPETGSQMGYINWVIDRRVGSSRRGAGRSYCDVTAYFVADGLISMIDVESKNCGKFAKGRARGVPELLR